MDALVYLADLRHNYSGHVNVDAMPLGVAYMKAVMDRELPGVSSRLFAYPDHLWEAMQENPPDVLMLSNYVWNERLSCLFATLAKQLRPDTLVVMGGPNIPSEDERQLDFVRGQPAIDVYALGEADFQAAEIVRQYLEAGNALSEFRGRNVPSAIKRDPDGGLVMDPVHARHREVDDIPSAFLTGILDEFFDGRLAPMIETNRGCPFTCTFCVQGSGWYTKVHNFSKDRLFEELDYIGSRVSSLSPSMGTLVIADPNYGMFERDVEISGHIAKVQAKHAWPKFISASTGKNRPDRIIRALDSVNSAMSFRQALQSTNAKTLKYIKRSNISQQAYADVMSHVQGRGMRSVSDLILGLPGETLESHLSAIRGLVNARTHELHNFQAMLLKGTELETVASREKFKFESRFRVLPKQFGQYGGYKVFDMDEIVVANEDMSFDDYIQARKYGFAFSVFWNNSWFEDAIVFAEQFGIRRSDILDGILDALEADTSSAKTLLDQFIRETTNELFATPEECHAFYSSEENFQRLVDGEIGDNLIYKYRTIASFFSWPEVCRIAMHAIGKLLRDRGVATSIDDFETFWNDLRMFVECKHAHGRSIEEILAPATALLAYDISAWQKAGNPKDPSRFRLDERRNFSYQLGQKAARELQAALRVWGVSVKGLTKGVTRIRAEWQVRDAITTVPQSESASA